MCLKKQSNFRPFVPIVQHGAPLTLTVATSEVLTLTVYSSLF